jgi:hypothetical protein
MLYFGCIDFGCIGHKVGHHLVTWDGSPPHKYEKNLKEAGLFDRINGGFCPNRGVEGNAKLTQENGWTILAWWDNSVDSRPGSHSTFLKYGIWSADEMRHWAAELFPDVMRRQKKAPMIVETSTARTTK